MTAGHIIKLYITGETNTSRKATKDLENILNAELKGLYTLEVIDILKTPKLAVDNRILATPTVVKTLPPPLRKIIGDLSDKERVLFGLDLVPKMNGDTNMKKILIADDSLFMRMSLKDNLPERYEIVEADSGPRTLEQFENQKPDLVLLDIVMPDGEKEGVRVLREIMQSNPQACVVMITAVGQEATIEECKKLGAKDYIVKPFDESIVAETVEKYLEPVLGIGEKNE